MKLPLKLAILVIVIFGLLCIGMALWRPMKVRYYAYRLGSENAEVRTDAVKKLLALDPEPVFRHYTERYESKEVKERMAVVDELCGCGDKGKAMMKEIFRNRCYSEQVRIPAGTLTPANDSKVEIKSLYMDRYEVTKEKYHVFCRFKWSMPPIFKLPLPPPLPPIIYETADYPVTNVSWHNAKAYADWLGMRLPTQHEWEYAARAGSIGKYCFGDNESLLDEYAWHKNNSGEKSHPVGQKKPNNWGLYDVHGNIMEYTLNTEKSWMINAFSLVCYSKGGAFDANSGTCNISHIVRLGSLESGFAFAGFRCVRDVK